MIPENEEDQISDIQPGDIVRWKTEPGYFWMTVDAVEGDQALCTYRALDNPIDGDVRPSEFIPKQKHFPIDELIVQRGH